jgi:hypothetical protein
MTPRYFVEYSVWRVCWWSTYLWCIGFFLVVMCMTEHLSGWNCISQSFSHWNLKVNSKSVKEKAYTSLMRPKLEYSSCVWDPHTKYNISKLEMVQRRAAIVQQQLGAGFTVQWFSGSRSSDMSLSLYGYVYMSGCVCIIVFYYIYLNVIKKLLYPTHACTAHNRQ